MATQQIRTAIETAKNVADANDRVKWQSELRPILEDTLDEIDTLDSTLAARRDVTVPIALQTIIADNRIIEQLYFPNCLSFQDMGRHMYSLFVKTGIRESSHNFFSIHVKGYSYNRSKSIDFIVSGYMYDTSAANIDATRKGMIHIAFSKNSDFDFPVGIGISDDGFATLKIGSSTQEWYYEFFTCDYTQHISFFGAGSHLGWSVQNTPVTFVDYHDLTATILKKTMTYAERMLLTPPLRQVGIEVYQTDSVGSELEGKYVYKSTGWAYLG